MDTILEIARSIRPDAWVDYAPSGAFVVGFADNREVSTYNADAASVAGALLSNGFKVRLRPGDASLAFAVLTARA